MGFGRREFLRTAGLGAASLCLAPGVLGAQPRHRPNFVFMLADDLGWNDVSYHGGDIATPNIDRIAKEGVELDRFYACPVCTPTRAGLLTGRYPHRFGMYGGTMKPWLSGGLPPEEELLPEVLADAGYERRACMGKWHLGHADERYHPLRQGFTEFYGHLNGSLDYYTHRRLGELDWHRDYDPCRDVGYSTELLAERAAAFVESARDPFLLYLPFNAPHTPLQAPDEALRAYGFDSGKRRMRRERRWGEKRSWGTRGKGNTRRQTYSAVVSVMDAAVGEVLEALDRRVIADDTFVLFMSDNGGMRGTGNNVPLRGGKSKPWEGGVRVVAAARWPAGLGGSRKIDGVTGYVDVLPTVRSILCTERPPAWPLDGIDLLDVLRGHVPVPDDRMLFLGPGAVVTRRWKLVKGRLYRIDRDPGERRDVAGRYPGVRSRLQRAAMRFQRLQAREAVVNSASEPTVRGFQPPKDWTSF